MTGLLVSASPSCVQFIDILPLFPPQPPIFPMTAPPNTSLKKQIPSSLFALLICSILFITASLSQAEEPKISNVASENNRLQYVTLHVTNQTGDLDQTKLNKQIHQTKLNNQNLEYYLRTQVNPLEIRGMKFHETKVKLGLENNHDIVDTFGIISALIDKGWTLINVSQTTYHFLKPVE